MRTILDGRRVQRVNPPSRGDQLKRQAGGGKVISLASITTPGSGEIVASESCYVDVWEWGGGASGGNASASGQNGRGGGPGAAFYARFPLSKDQIVSYYVANGGVGQANVNQLGVNGEDSTVTLPSGLVLRAGGGKNDGSAGVAVGGSIHRTGVSVTTDTSAGGDAPSFADFGALLAGGRGSAFNASLAGGDPGAGSGGNDGSGASGRGGNGKLFYIITAR